MKKLVMLVVLAASMSLIASCGSSSGGGGGDEDVDEDVCGGATLGCVAGSVTTTAGAAISSASVTIESADAQVVNGKEVISYSTSELGTANEQGWFSLSEISEGGNVFCFSADGYFKSCRTVSIDATKTTNMTPTVLVSKGDGVTGDVAAIIADTSTASGIQFAASGACDSNGDVVTGDITCYFGPVDVTGTDIEFAPGNFRATAADDSVGTMVSSALLAISCEQNGSELSVCSGKTAGVAIPIYDTSCASLPPTIEGWYFDEVTGAWIQTTEGVLNKSCTTDESDSYYGGTINHLSWINGDLLVDDACLTGSVLIASGSTGNNLATVKCYGSGWQNETYADSDGRFCVPVPAGYTYTCKTGDSTRWIDGTENITGTAPTDVVSFPVASCPADGCESIGSFVFASPILTTTLSWGVAPTDLDSHMINTDASVHIAYYDKENDPVTRALDLDKGSLTSSPYIELDTDDVTSYGPEITTVIPDVADGKHCFYVHNFSGEANMANQSVDQEGNAKSATVIVEGDGLGQTFTIPSSNANEYRYWRLYTIEFESGAIKASTFLGVNDIVQDEPTDCDW